METAGNILTSEYTDAFGNTTGSVSTDPFSGFGGQWGYYTDSETGLTLCGHRYYDSGVGRWLTRDPIGAEGGVNIYGYCRNRPIGYADPRGLFYVSIGYGVVGGFGLVGWGGVDFHVGGNSFNPFHWHIGIGGNLGIGMGVGWKPVGPVDDPVSYLPIGASGGVTGGFSPGGPPASNGDGTIVGGWVGNIGGSVNITPGNSWGGITVNDPDHSIGTGGGLYVGHQWGRNHAFVVYAVVLLKQERNSKLGGRHAGAAHRIGITGIPLAPTTYWPRF